MNGTPNTVRQRADLRHLIAQDDVDVSRLDLICNYASEAERGWRGLAGKVLGLVFIEESTRTASGLKSAVIRAGGGWLGIEGRTGTYVGAGLERIADAIDAVACVSDIVAVRASVGDDLLRAAPVPLINAGNDVVTPPLWGIWLLYELKKTFDVLSGLKVLVYGAAGWSTPVQSYYAVLSHFGMHFYEDPVVGPTATKPDTVERIAANGSVHQFVRLGEAIHLADLLIIADATPPGDCEPAVVADFFSKLIQVDAEIIGRLPQQAKWFWVMPRKAGPGRWTVRPELDTVPNLLNKDFLRDSVFCSTGILRDMLQRV